MIPVIETREELEEIWQLWKQKYLNGEDTCEFDEELGELLLEKRRNGTG